MLYSKLLTQLETQDIDNVAVIHEKKNHNVYIMNITQTSPDKVLIETIKVNEYNKDDMGEVMSVFEVYDELAVIINFCETQPTFELVPLNN